MVAGNGDQGALMKESKGRLQRHFSGLQEVSAEYQEITGTFQGVGWVAKHQKTIRRMLKLRFVFVLFNALIFGPSAFGDWPLGDFSLDILSLSF